MTLINVIDQHIFYSLQTNAENTTTKQRPRHHTETTIWFIAIHEQNAHIDQQREVAAARMDYAIYGNIASNADSSTVLHMDS
eukprot:m.348335 g.348335  ORF g.348335 m.348335 type:complete len:82 (-) comp20672_c1_seq54:1512-1757(-)